MENINNKEESISHEKLELLNKQEKLREQLAETERLLSEVDSIPEEVIISPEGQEITEGFFSRMKGRIGGFFSGMKEKMVNGAAYFDNPSNVAKVLAPASLALVAIPTLSQIARSTWPEAAQAFDSLPDIANYLMHFNAHREIFGLDNTEFVDQINLLNDVASGAISAETLTPDQSESLTSINQAIEQKLGPALENMNNPEKIQQMAQEASEAQAAFTTIENTATVGGTALMGGFALHKVGNIAEKYKNEDNLE